MIPFSLQPKHFKTSVNKACSKLNAEVRRDKFNQKIIFLSRQIIIQHSVNTEHKNTTSLLTRAAVIENG